MKRKIEIFTAGCPLCDAVVKIVQELACPSCEVKVYDLRKEGGDEAKRYSISRVPTVVVEGKIADCCKTTGVDREILKASGIGTPL
ncbi:MAG: thioredoxin family protein [bacterium JZ-2024 1]